MSDSPLQIEQAAYAAKLAETEKRLRLPEKREAFRDFERLSSTLRRLADRLAKAYLKYRMWRIS